MIFLNEKLDKISFDEAFTKIDNATKASWGAAKPVVCRPDFFSCLKNYEKDAVSDEQCELANAYFEKQSDFRVNEAREFKEKGSAILGAFMKAADLCMFCKCLVVYHDVMVNFIPLQNEVQELNK